MTRKKRTLFGIVLWVVSNFMMAILGLYSNTGEGLLHGQEFAHTDAHYLVVIISFIVNIIGVWYMITGDSIYDQFNNETE